MPTTGRCNCSSVTITLDELPEECALCYCSNCRRSGSGPCSIVYYLPRASVTISDPQSHLKTYNDNDTKSGSTVYRSFCGNCGSPVFSSKGPQAEGIYLKGGLFDRIPEPGLEFLPEDNKPGWMSVKTSGQ